MNTKAFIELLQEHGSKSLSFEYSPGKMVKRGYHITEVKHVKIESVDCGSRTDNWNETVIQLWENPDEPKMARNLSAYKALGILNKVGKMKPYNEDAILKFEYGNSQFHAAQLLVHSYELSHDSLTIKLYSEKTDCKAKEACGIEEVMEAVSANVPCCTPDGNCC